MLTRRGVTVIELIVALTLATIILGAATASLLRQQQGNARARSLTDADQQLSASLAVLASQVGRLHRRTDLAAGELRDTVLQANVPIVFSLSCTSSGGALTLASDTSDVSFTGVSAAPKAGDSLSWRTDSAWRTALITGVAQTANPCAIPITVLSAAWAVNVAVADTIPIGTPVRVSRQTRYSVYRASDGTWQLGFREATGIPAVFASPQPVVGPLLPRRGSQRTRFRYFDAAGRELLSTSSPAPADSVALIRFVALSRLPVHPSYSDTIRVDSVDISLLHARGP